MVFYYRATDLLPMLLPKASIMEGHLESYYDYINNEIWDTLSAFDPTWKDESDIKKILQSLSDDDKSKVRAEICNTLTKLKEKLLNGEIVIHN